MKILGYQEKVEVAKNEKALQNCKNYKKDRLPGIGRPKLNIPLERPHSSRGRTEMPLGTNRLHYQKLKGKVWISENVFKKALTISLQRRIYIWQWETHILDLDHTFFGSICLLGVLGVASPYRVVNWYLSNNRFRQSFSDGARMVWPGPPVPYKK